VRFSISNFKGHDGEVMSKERIYLGILMSVCIVLMLIVAVINVTVDPYAMFGLLNSRVNRIKREAADHARLYTAGVISRRAPVVLALGTSRGARGISMHHPGWQGAQQERYNASLVGANMYEIERYFEHAHGTRPLAQVVVGLDFFAFNLYRLNQSNFNDSLLLDDRGNSRLLHLVEMAKISFSLDTLYSSWFTVQCNWTACDIPFLSDGRENPQLLERALRDGGGQHNAFRASAEAGLTRLHFPPPYGRFAITEPNQENQLKYLARMLEIARRDHIDLRLFISPTHAVQCEVLRVAGLWTEFEQWKQQLVAMLEQDATRHPGEPVIPLWDFSGYNSITTEPIPVPGDNRARMKWYWESSHYRKELGDLVLDRVLGYRATGRVVPEDFGILLTRESLAQHLSDIRHGAIAYRDAHPDQWLEIEQLGADVERKKHPQYLYPLGRR
jgi:hypothetical protein